MSRLIEGVVGAPDNRKLLTQGLSQVHISEKHRALGFNGAGITRDDFQTMEHSNDRRHLGSRFHDDEDLCGHGRNTPLVKYDSPKETTPEGEGGFVTVIVQDSRYSERSILIAGASEKQLANCNAKGQVEAIYPAQLPPDVRLGYVASLLGGLQTAHGMTEDGNRALVIEHLTPDISRPKRQVPRSVVLPHGFVGIFDNDHIIPTEIEIDHLRAEQQGLPSERMNWLAGTMFVGLLKSLRESEFDAEKFSMRRREEPKGYEILFDITPEELTDPKNIAFVTHVLDAEHAIYEDVAEKLYGGLPDSVLANDVRYALKPQPASRDIMYIDGGHLVKSKFPIAYSHAGTLESLGVILDRSPDHPEIHPENAVEIFRGRAAVNIENTFLALGLSRAN